MKEHPDQTALRCEIRDGDWIVGGALMLETLDELIRFSDKQSKNLTGDTLTLRLDELEQIDSAGVALLTHLREQYRTRGIHLLMEGAQGPIREKLEQFSAPPEKPGGRTSSPGFFERLGNAAVNTWNENVVSFLQLAADIAYWSIAGLFKKRLYRKGEVANQAVLLGVNAAFIVGTMSFIIGLVLALQSAAQLRAFGANVYIVDLTVIAMMTEMGPLITAIMVAGRSSSSIAAEIATMKVTSETDALKMMGLPPIRFVVLPKVYGGMLTMPFLTILADVTGILGGFLIALSALDISPLVFINRMQESLGMRDIIFGIVKSMVFINLIILTGCFFGFRVKEGAASVGRVTTRAVVVALSLVIVADSLMGLLFYG